MKSFARTSVVIAALTATSALLLTPSAWAVPSYSRRYGVECSTCHTMWGALNGAGVTFRLSGYRAINGRDLTPVDKDIELSNGLFVIPTTLPLSIVTGVGIDARTEKREASDGTSMTRTGSSLALEDASIFLTSPVGKNLSAFIEFPMYETRAGEFLPTGPAEANDKTHGDIQFSTEKPVFEVAKFWWNSLIPSAPRDSVNLLVGITHLPLAYSPGKVRLSVNQYPVYERRALDLISPKLLSSDLDDGLFRLSEPQIILEVNGMVVPGKAVTDVGKRDTLWLEYHIGVTNGSNDKADPNNQKDLYGRLIARWYNQSLGVFAYYSADTYGTDIRNAGTALGIMNTGGSHNSTTRIGPDMTLSLAPLGYPVWLENQLLFNRESDPTGFGKEFKWTGGFDQLNWQIMKTAIVFGRYDWISGKSFDDTSVPGGVTKAKPNEWDVVAGIQYLVRQNVKLVAEYRHDVFEDKASTPQTARVTTDGYTVRAMVGF
jgi:hypothetical protein